MISNGAQGPGCVPICGNQFLCSLVCSDVFYTANGHCCLHVSKEHCCLHTGCLTIIWIMLSLDQVWAQLTPPNILSENTD